jgi:hypothetical protein
LVIKNSKGKFPILDGSFNPTIIYKCGLFHCHVWLPEGI